MDSRKLAVLTIVGALCLPAPMYFVAVAEWTGPPDRSSKVYTATAVDLNDSDDREALLDDFGTAVALPVESVTADDSPGEYRAPNATRRTLLAAIENGSASAAGPDVRADLREIGANYRFLARGQAEPFAYYRVQLGDGNATVEASTVSPATVANATIDAVAVPIDRFDAAERRTVAAVVENATSGDDEYYRPLVDRPMPKAPLLVELNGTVYHVDPAGDHDALPALQWIFPGLAVSLFGVILLALSGTVYALEIVRD